MGKLQVKTMVEKIVYYWDEEPKKINGRKRFTMQNFMIQYDTDDKGKFESSFSYSGRRRSIPYLKNWVLKYKPELQDYEWKEWEVNVFTMSFIHFPLKGKPEIKYKE